MQEKVLHDVFAFYLRTLEIVKQTSIINST